MADDTRSRFATVSHLQFKMLVVGHTTKHMTYGRSWDMEILTTLGWKCHTLAAPSCDILNLGSSYFHVQLTTVRHPLIVLFVILKVCVPSCFGSAFSVNHTSVINRIDFLPNDIAVAMWSKVICRIAYNYFAEAKFNGKIVDASDFWHTEPVISTIYELLWNMV